MDALEQLQKTLGKLTQVALAKMRTGDSLQIINERTKLKSWIGEASQLDEFASGSMEKALHAFQESGYLQGVRQILLVCHGCMLPFGDNTFSLIESRPHFEALLNKVDTYSNRRRTFRKFYRGLLHCYFSYDPLLSPPGLDGRVNREALRDFLSRHLGSLPINELSPDWLRVLNKYPDLLSDDPYRPFELFVLQGEWSGFNHVRESLEISAGSWFVKQMVRAPFNSVGKMDDPTFLFHLEGFLLLLINNPLYAVTGLKILLDRYALCKDKELHESLMDFAVGLWGNPWLPDTAHQWQCSPVAREMLAHWLKRHLLGEFFSLLSNDDKNHPRRFHLWDLYSEDMTGIYFALGKDAFTTDNMSLYRFKRIGKGLIARLTEGKLNVHACIMQFKNFHVIEFNRDNNVAYFYDIRQGPPAFYISKGWLELGAISVANITQGVDVTRLSKPIRHQDTKQLSWEGRFAQELGSSHNAIAAFCRKYQCVYETSPDQEQRQWIRPANPDQYGQEVWSVLTGWGFNFSIEEKSFFRLSGTP